MGSDTHNHTEKNKGTPNGFTASSTLAHSTHTQKTG